MSFFHAGEKPIWKPILLSIIIAAVICMLLTCIFAVTINMMPTVPYTIIPYVMIGIEGFSIMTGTYVACAIFKNRGLFVGAISGSIALLILLSIGLSVTKNSIGLLTLVRVITILLCGIGGGIAGVNRKDKVRIK